jgi:hypothetical protein
MDLREEPCVLTPGYLLGKIGFIDERLGEST